MKYGILGDVHANASALEAALQGLADADVDLALSVGDVVGYGAAPAACISLLREHGVSVVLGNHDQATAQDGALLGFNPAAAAAIAWTRTQLSRADRAWLGELPLVLSFDHAQLAHGSVIEPADFPYVFASEDAEPGLDALTRPLCFIGHTHMPGTFLRTVHDPVRTAFSRDTFVDLSEIEAAIANVGSVGQPRDGDPRAAYAVFDSDKRTLRLERASYDVEREAARIAAAGLPASLAERLLIGH